MNRISESSNSKSGTPTVLFFAGEASGDQHGSELIKQLKRLQPEWNLIGWGGDIMAEAGMELLSHYRDRAIMGLVEVIKNIRTIRGFMQQAKRDIELYRPEKVVFIDNPGFNLPLAKFAKKLGIEVHWYIAPKAWAWNERRIKTMRKCIDHLYVIFPFEPDFFASRGMKSVYVGNPTFESVMRFKDGVGKVEWESSGDSQHDNLRNPDHTSGKFNEIEDSTIPGKNTITIALLAGSRKAEVASLLPVFVKTALKRIPQNGNIRVAAAPGLTMDFYRSILEQHQLLQLLDSGKIQIEFNNTFRILHETAKNGGLALVASGTATLETALLGCPQIVAYQVNPLTYFVASNILKIKYVSLVNILLNRMSVEEHLKDVSEDILIAAMDRLEADRGRILEDYAELERLLEGSASASGGEEFASQRVAKLIGL
jgi:lipid-A-disaccharide synthase